MIYEKLCDKFEINFLNDNYAFNFNCIFLKNNTPCNTRKYQELQYEIAEKFSSIINVIIKDIITVNFSKYNCF